MTALLALVMGLGSAANASAEEVAQPAQSNAGTVKVMRPWKPRAAVTETAKADGDSLSAAGFGSFTPSIFSTGRLAPVPNRGPNRSQVTEQSFRFTPASDSSGGKKSVAIGINSRVLSAPATQPTATETASNVDGYDFDVELGYRGFAVFGGYSRVDLALGRATREAVDVGLGYRGRDWTTSLHLGRENSDFTGLTVPDLATRYSVELGGAYELTPRLLLSGGVRYKLSPSGELTRFDEDRPDGAVFLSTAISF